MRLRGARTSRVLGCALVSALEVLKLALCVWMVDLQILVLFWCRTSCWAVTTSRPSIALSMNLSYFRQGTLRGQGCLPGMMTSFGVEVVVKKVSAVWSMPCESTRLYARLATYH
jgi:hypothetical protein